MYIRITQIDRRSMLHVGELKYEVDWTTVCIEFVGPCFFPIFFSFFFFFFFFFFFWGGGGGGGLKLRSYCRQCYSETIGRIYLKFCMSNFPRLILENLPSGFDIDPIRNSNSKFVRLPYLSRKYAFSVFEKQLHENYGTDFHQIWCNDASYHRKDSREIWHLSL